MGQYLADLEKAGILTGDKTPATLERLKEAIAEAEDDLVTGNAEIASVKLFTVVESPRYAKFDYAPEYAIAELTLARALIRAGALQVGRALPAARARARHEVTRVRARLPRAWSTSRSRRASRRRSSRCSTTSARTSPRAAA